MIAGTVALLVAFVLLMFAVVWARSTYRKMVAMRPKPVMYPSRADFDRMCAALAVAPDAPREELLEAFRNARRIAEELLARRIDGIVVGGVTFVTLKDIARDIPEYRVAARKAMEVFLTLDLLDAPLEIADGAVLRRTLASAHTALVALFEELEALPPRMMKGVTDGDSVPWHG